jgi:predicted patatin/cPLA2 family phospholipase
MYLAGQKGGEEILRIYMKLLPVNLILEGGAMRGMFTAGVLDVLDEKNLLFEFVIGVSAGSCMGASYISRQKGRSRNITLTYRHDPRYFGWRNLLREGNLFSAGFAYEDIPQKLIPFDYHAFEQSPQRFVVVATDCTTGQAVYLKNDTPEHKANMIRAIRASASMPFVSRPVPVGNMRLLDGGVADSIPVQYAMKNGHAASVLILTRPKGYFKKTVGAPGLFKFFMPRHPQLAEALYRRAGQYNNSLALAEKLADDGKCLIIYPPPDMNVGRLEGDLNKLDALYRAGCKAGLECAEKLKDFPAL